MGRGRKPKKRTEQELAKLDKALTLYKEGLSARACAREVGLPKDWVLAEIHKAGIFREVDLSFNENYFEKIDSEDKAYWLGFISADGSIHKKKKCLDISLSIVDIDHLEKFKESIEFKGEVKTKTITLKGKEYKSCRMSIYSAKLIEDLAKYGVVARKTLDFEYPDIPKEWDRDFIRGYSDGDGSIYVYNRKHSINPVFNYTLLGTEKFLSTVQEKFIEYVGVTEVGIYDHYKSEVKEYKKAFNQALRIVEWLYKDSSVYLDRKVKLYNDYCRLYQK